MKISVNKMVAAATVLAMMVSSSASLPVVAETSSSITKNYQKFVIGEDEPTPYPLSIDVNYSTQTRGIIGDDERVRDGSTGIVLLSYDGRIATGFIVGDHTIATAAHCVNAKYSNDLEHKARYAEYEYFRYDIAVYLYDDNGNKIPNSQLTPVELHVPEDYLNYRTSGSDYALITVEEDLSGYTHFDLGVPYDVESTAFGNLDLFVTGIPGTIPDNDGDDIVETPINTLYQVYTGKGKEHPSYTSTSEQLRYTCDTVGGNSGGPVYVAYQYTSGSKTIKIYTAIAVHYGGAYDMVNDVAVYKYNCGSAMTPYKIQFYNNNPNLSYTKE